MQQWKTRILLIIIGFVLAGCGLPPRPLYTLDNPPSRDDHPLAQHAVHSGDHGVGGAPSMNARKAFSADFTLNASVVARNLAAAVVPYLDTPYKYGGESVNGIDCSGLVLVVFRDAFNIALPHKAAYQIALGNPVDKKRLLAGDLIFFHENNNRNIGHVGIYLGQNRFIHSMSKKGVVISTLTEGYWQKYYAGARRLLGAENINFGVGSN